jgi:3-keto-disaccharide hydrolase
MKRKLMVVLMLVTVLGLVSASWAGTVLFEDKFTSLDPGWGAPDNSFNIKDGKLTLTPAAKETYTAVYEGNIFPNDMDVSVTVKFVKAEDPNWGAGLLFWSKGLREFYGLLINANGWYTIQRRMGDRFINPVSWRASDAIKKGAGVDNKLRVVTNGAKATVYINDKEVITFTGQPPEGGSQIGVRGASGDSQPNVIEYTDFKVMKP